MPFPGPSVREVHVDAILTNMSVAYIQNQKDYIADQFAPLIPVQKQSDRYFVYTKGDWFRDEAQERAPGTQSAGSGYDLDNTPTYYAPVYALHQDVPDQIADNSDTPLRPYEDAQLFVTQRLLLKRERIWTSTYFGTGIWNGTGAGDITGVASGPSFPTSILQWDQPASTPIQDIHNMKALMLTQTGFEPNTLVLGYKAFHRVINNPSILDRIKYTQRGIVSADLLASLFELDKVLVGKATVNTAQKGAVDAFQLVHGNHALLAYVAPNPGLRVPSAAYTFAWTGLLGAGAFANRIKRFRMEWLESDRIEGEMAFACKVVAADLGMFVNGVVGS